MFEGSVHINSRSRDSWSHELPCARLASCTAISSAHLDTFVYGLSEGVNAVLIFIELFSNARISSLRTAHDREEGL